MYRAAILNVQSCVRRVACVERELQHSRKDRKARESLERALWVLRCSEEAELAGELSGALVSRLHALPATSCIKFMKSPLAVFTCLVSSAEDAIALFHRGGGCIWCRSGQLLASRIWGKERKGAQQQQLFRSGHALHDTLFY